MSTQLSLKGRNKCHGGTVEFYQHQSEACNASMSFSVFRPPQAEKSPVPVFLWLSGLTCTEENFMAKAGAQRLAAEKGIMLVAPDTSPRGLDLPGEHESWDFGSGAGFYLNATRAPWSHHYRMYDYVVDELPRIINGQFPARDDDWRISGHSMGGHGALVIGQRNQTMFREVSAFAPICAPMHCPWGVKAFTNYLGEDRAAWAGYDSCEILKNLDRALPMTVHQGMADNFLTEQLKPELLEAVCREKGHALKLHRHDDYDHSYYFIASFLADVL